MNFEIISSENHYHGRAFDVERVNAHLPDGRTHHYDLVKHKDSVTILPIDSEGNIWFVSQYRLGAMNTLIELPAGVLELDELPEIGASREVREETGMAAGKLQKIGEFYLAPGYSSEFMHIFLATELHSDPLQADEDEFIKVRKIPVKEVYEMAEKGELKDAKTLGALLLARQFIHSAG